MQRKVSIFEQIANRVEEHGNSQRVTELCLDEIDISSFEPQMNYVIEKCKNVIHLSASTCGLVSLNNLPQLKNLKYLDLQDNLFTDENLSELLNQFQDLDGLNLSKNRIQSIDNVIKCVNKLSVKEVNIFETGLLNAFPKCIEKLFESCKSLQCVDWEDKKGKEVKEFEQESSSSQSQSQGSFKQYSDDESSERSIQNQSSKKIKVE